MKSSQADDLVDIEPSDRPALDELEAAHCRGARIMSRVVVVWGVVSVLATGLVGALSTHVGPVGAISGAVFAFVVLIYFVSRRRLAKLKQDRASGKKLLVEAIIDQKEVTGAGGETSALQYFLHLKGSRYWVDAKSYDVASEGDRVRLEYLPTSELVLRITGQP